MSVCAGRMCGANACGNVDWCDDDNATGDDSDINKPDGPDGPDGGGKDSDSGSLSLFDLLSMMTIAGLRRRRG
ncbi:hypothetical protein [Ferrimonas lipolytica]|uniref:Uncharacterized protein n=1 Tax=Ferrimonas lipolytica TaxID=2724191 RepID=A0A6H1UFY5_9GAMM|nr:hypothetical protein [Ferrimonas lipolytica]QIZ77233.1 hypothetical protein HER31_10285 [Ferrimonas lipolytica]